MKIDPQGIQSQLTSKLGGILGKSQPQKTKKAKTVRDSVKLSQEKESGSSSRLRKMVAGALKETEPVDPQAFAPVSREEAAEIMSGIQERTLQKTSTFMKDRVFLPFETTKEGKTRQLNFMLAMNRLEAGKTVEFKSHAMTDHYGAFYHEGYEYEAVKISNFNQLRDFSLEPLADRFEFANQPNSFKHIGQGYQTFLPSNPGDKKQSIDFSQAFERIKSGKAVDFQLMNYSYTTTQRDEDGYIEHMDPVLHEKPVTVESVRISNPPDFAKFARRVLKEAEPQTQPIPSTKEILKGWESELQAEHQVDRVVYQPYRETEGGIEAIDYKTAGTMLTAKQPVYFQPEKWVCYSNPRFGGENYEYRKVDLGEEPNFHFREWAHPVKWTKISSPQELKEFYQIERAGKEGKESQE